MSDNHFRNIITKKMTPEDLYLQRHLSIIDDFDAV